MPIVRFAWTVVALMASGAADAQSLSTRQSTFPGGGGVVAVPPFEIYATLGEPAVSRLAAGDFVLYSGFQATVDAAPRAQVLFRDGFEPAPVLPPVPPPLPP